jgi:hypothetical protein
MQEGRNRSTFGTFIVRVALITLAFFLLGFIIWGVVKLIQDYESVSDAAKWIGIILLVGLIALGVGLLVRFIRSNQVSLNFKRIAGIFVGLLLVGFIGWGVYRLADTNDYAEVATTPDSENATITIDSPSSEAESEANGNDQAGNDQPAEGSSPEQASPDDQPSPNPSQQIAGTGPTDQPLPNTGPASNLASAIALGLTAYLAKLYIRTRKQLKQF